LYDTILGPGDYAVILDADYAYQYTIPGGTLLLTTDDRAIGSGLAISDPVYLFEPDASTLIDSYTFPSDPGNGYSVEKDDPLGGDALDNWKASACVGGSPGEAGC
jgi:hypothetical protein